MESQVLAQAPAMGDISYLFKSNVNKNMQAKIFCRLAKRVGNEANRRLRFVCGQAP